MIRDRLSLNKAPTIDTSVAPSGFASPVRGVSISQTLTSLSKDSGHNLRNLADYFWETLPVTGLFGFLIIAGVVGSNFLDK